MTDINKQIEIKKAEIGVLEANLSKVIKEIESLDNKIHESVSDYEISDSEYQQYLDNSSEYRDSQKMWRLVEITKSQSWSGFQRESSDGMRTKSVGGGYIPSYFVFQSEDGVERRVIAKSILPMEKTRIEQLILGSEHDYLKFDFLSQEQFVIEEKNLRELRRKGSEFKVLWKSDEYQSLKQLENEIKEQLTHIHADVSLLQYQANEFARAAYLKEAAKKVEDIKNFCKDHQGTKASLRLHDGMYIGLFKKDKWVQNYLWETREEAIKHFRQAEGLPPLVAKPKPILKKKIK